MVRDDSCYSNVSPQHGIFVVHTPMPAPMPAPMPTIHCALVRGGRGPIHWRVDLPVVVDVSAQHDISFVHTQMPAPMHTHTRAHAHAWPLAHFLWHVA